MRHDLAEIEALLRRNAGRWILLEDKMDRGPLAAKCWRWRHHTPRFAGGRFEFRTFKERYSEPPRFFLEGRFSPVTFPIEGD